MITKAKKENKGKKRIEIIDQGKVDLIEENLIPEEEQKIPVEEVDLFKGKIEVDPELSFHKFMIPQATIKTVDEQGARSMQLLIIGGLENVEMRYDVIMVFDSEPLDEAVRKVESEKMDYESKAQMELFSVEKEKTLLGFDKRIKNIIHERDELKKKCQDISFRTKVLKVDDSNWKMTKIDMRIPAPMINKLNDAWDLIPQYKLQFQKI